jgi:hypothetical protein
MQNRAPGILCKNNFDEITLTKFRLYKKALGKYKFVTHFL